MTRANTAIPGLGAPITAVDVTFDGKWVLATTNKYLMVVKTVFKVGLVALSEAQELSKALQNLSILIAYLNFIPCKYLPFMKRQIRSR